MGQYHIAVNLDRKEYLHPHALGNGLKLWEQAACPFGITTAIHAALAVSNGRGGGDYDNSKNHEEFVGRWGGDRIAIIGDYADSKDLQATDYAEYIYNACSYESEEEAREAYPDNAEYIKQFGPLNPSDWVNITPMAAAFLCEEFQLEVKGTGWVDLVPNPGSFFDQSDDPLKRIARQVLGHVYPSKTFDELSPYEIEKVADNLKYADETLAGTLPILVGSK